MDVVAFNLENKRSKYAKLKQFLEITKAANAQGTLGGITVQAIQIQGGEEVVVDQDTTDDNGSFSLDVPAGAIIVRFMVGDEIIDILMDVPEAATVELTVNIDINDQNDPVEIIEMDVLDDVDDDQPIKQLFVDLR